MNILTWLGKRFTVYWFTDYWKRQFAPRMIWSLVPPCNRLHKFSSKVSSLKSFLGSSFWKKKSLHTQGSRVCHSVGGMGRRCLWGAHLHPMSFLKSSPSKPMPPLDAPLTHLKMKPPSPTEKQTPLLKLEAPYHEMIPRKSRINNNLKSS